MAGGGVLPSGPVRVYNGHQTFYLWFCVLLGGAGGLLLGYDNGVMGGVVAMDDFQIKFFPHIHQTQVNFEKTGQSNDPYCKYDNQILQLMVSILYIAGAFAALLAARFIRIYGRKLPLLVAGIFFLIGTGIMAGAVHVAMLVVGRVLLGFGVGIASLVVPMLNAELSPPKWRGALTFLFQLWVTIGILVAGLVNYGSNFIHPWGWRLPLAVAAAPGLVVLLGGILLPDSPVSLAERGKLEQARRVLTKIRGVEDVNEEFGDIVEAARQGNLIKRPWANIFRAQYRPLLYISLLFMMFQQFTGINAIVFYAPIIFSSLGKGSTVSLENTVIIGAVFVLATAFSMLLVDRVGRRLLLIQGGLQMIAAEIVAGVVLATQFSEYGINLPHNASVGILVVICVFIAGFAWSWGPVGWLYPIEIQPLEMRAAGSSVNTASNMLFTFVIGQCFVTMLCSMKWGVFIFFAGIVIIMTLWVALLIPETRGKDLENTFRAFQEHWFWGRGQIQEVHAAALPQHGESQKSLVPEPLALPKGSL